jgi:thiamine biosynthesis lipoprotein ApbE
MEAAVTPRFEEVRRLDEMLSNYRADSEWSEVNRHAAEKPVKLSPELFQLLSACVAYSRESEGAFDISVGPLMKVWGFYKGSGHLPHRAEVPPPSPKWVTGTCAWTRRPGRCGLTAPGWNWTPAESARATPWIAWWMF